MNSKTIISLSCAAILGGLLLGFRWGDARGERRGFDRGYAEAVETIIAQSDTITRTDTLRVPVPVPVAVAVKDTVLVPADSLVFIHDTTFVALERETKVYRDSSYLAVVSGYRPSLDRIEVYQKTRTVTVVTEPETRSRWSFGVTAGPSVIIDLQGRPDAGFGVTAGLTYTFRK